MSNDLAPSSELDGTSVRLVPDDDQQAEPEEDRVGPEDQQEPGEEVGQDSILRDLLEWAAVLVFAVAVALFLRAFVLQSFWIESGSMERTLEVRDRVVVNRLSYRFGDPSNGDIVVFDRPDDLAGPSATKDLIKRIIGIGGDTVEGRDGVVYLNGLLLDEPYLQPEVYTTDFGPVDVPDGELWLMGDNRERSSDSRSFGPVSTDHVVGRAFFRFWPLGRAGSP